MLRLVDRDWLVACDSNVSLVTNEGTWAINRHPLNARGDLASVLERQNSVEQVGIIRDVRGGAWLVQDEAPSVHDRFSTLHWATLVEGAERAWMNDTLKQNQCVQATVASGLTRTKVYSRRTPIDALKFLIDLGNQFNAQVHTWY